MSKAYSVLLCRFIFVIAVSLPLLSIIAWSQDQPDPRKWNIDPRISKVTPTGEPLVLPQAKPNFENPNKNYLVFNTPHGTYTVAPNVRVHPSATIWQSEVPITRHPTNPNIMYGSSNAVRFSPTAISEGMYLTTDGGVTWSGSDTTAAAPINNHGGDPAPAIDANGRFYQSYLGFSVTGMYTSYSTDMGTTWANTITLESGSQDKNHTFVDNTPGSPYFGRVYVTWSRFTVAQPPAVVSYSTNSGVNWSAVAVVSTPAASHYHQGVNGAVGPNGIAYICWQNPVTSSPFTGDYIGFAKSTNGGATWTATNNVYDCNGIRGTLSAKANLRVNDFPSMGVDMTNGVRAGWIYIVTAEKNLAPAGTDPDIVLHKSTDGGTTWSAGVRVNQDAANNGKIQYMPWLRVDEGGGVNVIYYDDRNTSSDSAEVMVSRSVDGGTTWTDIVVSDHRFKPAPIAGLASGYQGDYIGITSGNGKLWPYWSDNSSGIYQAWIAGVTPPTTISIFPYTEDFEGASANDNPNTGGWGWTTGVYGGSINEWVKGTPAKTQITGAHSGANAYVTKLTGDYSNNQKSYLQSPIMNFSSLGGAPTLSFWHNFSMEANDWDAAVVEFSTDGGTVWRRVDSTLGTGATFNTPNSIGWYNSSSVNGSVTNLINPPKFALKSTAYAGNSSGWIQSMTSLVGLAGLSDVRLRWKFGTDVSNTDGGPYDGWAIDDVSITTTPLPIQLGYLHAVNINGNVHLNWGTISEINNYGFELEKTQSVPDFITVPNSFIAGHGTTNEPQHYSFVDNAALSGEWFYRLKQTDLDGTIHFTDPIQVSVLTTVNNDVAPREFSLSQNYPNPFNPSTQIKFSVQSTDHARLEVFNILGQKVATLYNDIAEAGVYHIVSLDGTSLSSGIYFYQLESGKKIQLKKLILLK
ncbi:MAG: T9SS type A sorting domain-containing protein [bacterium]